MYKWELVLVLQFVLWRKVLLRDVGFLEIEFK